MSTAREDNLPEVVPETTPEALSQAQIYKQHGLEGGEEKFPHTPAYEPSPISPTTAYSGALPPSDASTKALAATAAAKEERRVCGLKRRTFWIILALLLAVIIGVGVGVGVGIGVGSGSSDGDDSGGDAQGQDDSEDDLVSTTSSTSTSEPEPTPSFLANSTDTRTGFAFEGYSKADYEGEFTGTYYEDGFTNFDIDVVSYIWFQNDTGCCVMFCQGRNTSVGWRCQNRRRREASQSFDRIFVGCGEDADEENLRCDEVKEYEEDDDKNN